jgi:hypothetical protein
VAVDYPDLIEYISDENPIYEYKFNILPDTCPICSVAISPEFILVYEKDKWYSHLLCGCPRNECASLFFAVYSKDMFSVSPTLHFRNCYPYSKIKKDFPQEISELSSNFVEIYNQAYIAEQENLDLICGVGYRKSLEYLIKDYVISLFPAKETKLKGMLLQQCIQQFIAEPTIKQMAERATWLGNDETHYVRKWDDKDLQDLKNLIDLTVFYISMSIKASRYMEEMTKK